MTRPDTDNPYRVGAGIEAGQPVSQPRSVPEYVVLASFAGFPLSIGAAWFAGDFSGLLSWPLGLALWAAFILSGVLAFWLLWKRRHSGPLAAMGFYAIQLVAVSFPSGLLIRFASLPTVFFDLYDGPGAFVRLNFVSTMLFLLSVRIWREYTAD